MAGYIGSATAVVSNGGEKKVTVTASGGQTAISNVSYAPGQVDVYHNGVRLVDGTDYTATNGTSITLTVAAAANDQIVVRSFNTFQVSDNVSASGGGSFAADVTFATGADIITSSLGTSNFRAGVNAGNSIASGGNYNVTVGDEAGTAITTGDGNVAIGYQALDAEDAHGLNTAIGYQALSAQDAGFDAKNTAVGYQAGGAVTEGDRNTLVGTTAGSSLTHADFNVALGEAALAADTLGSRSTAVGRAALNAQNFTTATDTYNTAVGNNAGLSVTTGTFNTLIGGLAGDATDDGVGNTAVGYNSLSANAANYNVAIGHESLVACTGTNNTSVGAVAGSSLTSGSNNIFIGRDAGVTGSPGGNITTASNEIGLGDENISAANIQVDWTVASDQRDKTDFTALDLGLDFVKALAPVTYKWDKRSKYIDKTDVTTYNEDGSVDHEGWDITTDLNTITHDGTHKEDWLDIGFKAQAVQALEEAAGYTTAAKKNLTVSTSGDGKQMGIQYSKFIPILVKAIQEQNALIEALTVRVTELEG